MTTTTNKRLAELSLLRRRLENFRRKWNQELTPEELAALSDLAALLHDREVSDDYGAGR